MPEYRLPADENVIHSAKVADFVRHDRDFGSGTAPASVDIAEVRARKPRMVDGLVSMHLDKYKGKRRRIGLWRGQLRRTEDH